MKKVLLYIISTILCCGVMALAGIKLYESYSSLGDGVVTIRVIGENGEIVKEKEVTFNDGDNLADLISENFDGVVFSDGMLMNIEGFETPVDWSYFFWVKHNDIDATVGLKDLEFKDKDVIDLIYTENTYVYESN